MSQDRITFSCLACGSKDFKFPSDPKPDDLVTCAGCGATSRYEDVQKTALEQGQKAVVDMVRDAIKGIKGFKLE